MLDTNRPFVPPSSMDLSRSLANKRLAELSAWVATLKKEWQEAGGQENLYNADIIQLESIYRDFEQKIEEILRSDKPVVPPSSNLLKS